MKAFIAWLSCETNMFVPFPVSYRSFTEDGYLVHHGQHDQADLKTGTAPVFTFRRLAEARGWEIVESLTAVAEPGGRVVRSVYEAFRHEILDDLKTALPVDVVFLDLHGAMAAEGYDDCEGDLLARIREIVGPQVPIGAELDPHSNLTQAMLTNATALVMEKEYPHMDFAERTTELFHILAETAIGKIHPQMEVFDCRMIVIALHTTKEPGRSFVEYLQRLERENEDVLSVSLCHGMPWGDMPEAGAKALVITDNNPAKGKKLAEEVGRKLFDLRQSTGPDYFLTVDQALERAEEILRQKPGKPVVLADSSDNPGGGAAGDATFVLKALLERGIEGAAIATLWDPIAVGIATDAGEGARLALRIGGKMGPASGDPLDLNIEVVKVQKNATQTYGEDNVIEIGNAAVVRANGIEIILNTKRRQTFSVDIFSNLGIDPRQKRILVVKSSQHFRASFAPLAAEILYVQTPGALVTTVKDIPYRHIDRNKWPLVENPFASQT